MVKMVMAAMKVVVMVDLTLRAAMVAVVISVVGISVVATSMMLSGVVPVGGIV
jgi:hypothetical protein